MLGQSTVTKPNRSDEVLDANQQLQIASQIRARFDSLAPKRPTKPTRSESDTVVPNSSALSGFEQHNIPELDKLRSFQSQLPVVFPVEGTSMVQEEFVETQYYKELDSIDKQRHTTGHGFKSLAREEDESVHGYGIRLYCGNNDAAKGAAVSGYRSNPATNDWTPYLDEDQVFLSSKPNRSEGW